MCNTKPCIAAILKILGIEKLHAIGIKLGGNFMPWAFALDHHLISTYFVHLPMSITNKIHKKANRKLKQLQLFLN